MGYRVRFTAFADELPPRDSRIRIMVLAKSGAILTLDAAMARANYIGQEGKSTSLGWRLINSDGIERDDFPPNEAPKKSGDILDDHDFDILTERG